MEKYILEDSNGDVPVINDIVKDYAVMNPDEIETSTEKNQSLSNNLIFVLRLSRRRGCWLRK